MKFSHFCHELIGERLHFERPLHGLHGALGIRGVEKVRHYLMIAYIFLKRLEVLAATRRVAFAVAENRVHSRRGFDGEIAQVRFQRAVQSRS